MNRYDSYKETNVDWLGNIPSNWVLKDLKRVAGFAYGDSLKDEDRNKDGDIPVFGSNGQVGNHSTANTEAPAIIIGRKGSYGKVTYCSTPAFAIDTTYFVDRTVTNQNLRWLYYILEALDLDGFTQDSAVPGLSREFAYSKKVPFPSAKEQSLIANYLDKETDRIDKLITNKRQQIKMLGELRQITISHAITQGLDPAVPMKDSGVTWLGDIPAHWQVSRVRRYVVSMEQGWSPQCEARHREDEEWGVLKVGCVNGNKFNAEEHKALPHDLDPRPEYEIRKNDILISRANTRQLLGNACLVDRDYPRLMLCDKLYRLRLQQKRLMNEFLVYYLGTSIARYQIESEATGTSSSMQNIGQDTIKGLQITVPPLEDQRNVVRFIQDETEKFDSLVNAINKQIDKLEELRKISINDAVTGKVKVTD